MTNITNGEYLHLQSDYGLENCLAEEKYALESAETANRYDPGSHTLDKSLNCWLQNKTSKESGDYCWV